MKTFHTILLLIVSLVFTVSAQNLPACATSCLSLLPAGCNDANCVCTNKEAIASQACCYAEKCKPDELAAAAAAGVALCKTLGITVSTSEQPPCPGAPGSGNSTTTTGGNATTPAPAAASTTKPSGGSSVRNDIFKTWVAAVIIAGGVLSVL